MKLFYALCFVVFLPSVVQAQFDPNWGFISARQADSLRKTLATEKNDTFLMAANRSLAFYYGELNIDSNLYFNKQQLHLAEKLNLKMWLADAYFQIASSFQYLGNISANYENLMQSINLAKEEKYENSNWHPWLFSNAQNLHDARIAILGMSYMGMASFYGNLGDSTKASAAFKEAVRLGESINNGKILSLAYGNKAGRVISDSVLYYIKKSIEYEDKSGYKKYSGNSLSNIANFYFEKKQYDSAWIYFHRSVAVNKEQDNIRGLAFSYLDLTFAHIKFNQKDSSLYYARLSLSTAKAYSNPRTLQGAYSLTARAYELIPDIDSAYKYERLSNILNDSLQNARITQLNDYQNFAFNEQLRLKKINEEEIAYQNKLKLFGAMGGLAALLLVALLLYRNNRKKQQANWVLESTLSSLKSTQSQLIQSEKMASLGELTAGIAHEIQNPLNFVNNFSEVSNELIDEMKEEFKKGDIDEGFAIADDIKQNLEKINHHGKRAGDIVKGMLQHSRSSTGVKEPTDINALADEYLRLSYHGLRAKDKDFNAEMKTDFDESIGKINIIPQDIGRVFLNLYNNAFYACAERSRSAVNEEKKQNLNLYEPEVSVSTKKSGNSVLITVSDNGNGIPQKIVDKIFQPFFTTKPTGQGTGLGLSLSYDIIKAHGGEIKVESKKGEGTEFIISLPV